MSGAAQQPAPLRIGVSACFFHADPQRNLFKGKTLLYAEESMLGFLMNAGALPVLLPRALGPFSAETLMDGVDGLVLQGGADMAPGSYGETPARPEWAGDAVRDAYEIALVRAAMAKDRPILGICRGHQVLNVACGGTLWQDIQTMHPAARVHRDWDIYDQNAHEIELPPGGWLSQLYGVPAGTRGTVNSVHHQGIKDLGRDLVVEAVSVPDHIAEAIRFVGRVGERAPFAVGVQWHPEFMREGQGLSPSVLVKGFLAECDRRRSA